MNEPDVTLTNLVIVIECLGFAWACLRRPRSALRDAWISFFTTTALASASAGIVHGFATHPDSFAHSFFWPMSMIAIVLASASLVMAAGELLDTSGASRTRRFRGIALVTACIAAAVILGARDFVLAVAAYVPASLWLAFAMIRRWRTYGSVLLLVGAAGLVLAVVAGLLQQLRYTPAPDLLGHNAWYHALQVVALAAFFAGCRGALSDPYGGSRHARSS